MTVFSGLLYKKLRLFLLLVISSFTVAAGVYLSFWEKDREIEGIFLFTFGLMGFLISLAGIYISFKESISARKEWKAKSKESLSQEFIVGPSGALTGLPILQEWSISTSDWLHFWLLQYKLQLWCFFVAFICSGTGIVLGTLTNHQIIRLLSMGLMGVFCMLWFVWMLTRIYPFPFQSVQVTITTRSVGYNGNYFEFVNQRLWLTHVLLEKRNRSSQITIQSYWNSHNKRTSSSLKLPVPAGKLKEALKLCEELKALYFSQETEL